MNNNDLVKEIEVKGVEKQERLDMYLTSIFSELTRSQVQKMIKHGDVNVDGFSVKKTGQKITNGSLVSISKNFFTGSKDKKNDKTIPENIDLDIVYEDEYLAVINKPIGMVVHPGAGHNSGTLVNAIKYRFKHLSKYGEPELRPGILHRLDKETSGLIIVVKDTKSHKILQDDLKLRRVTRKYHAILKGSVKNDYGTIETFIGRSDKDRKKMGVKISDGKKAITHYKVLERFKGFVYVEFDLDTGRTHQIRVHSRHINAPVLGDKKYGHKKLKQKYSSLMLHAKEIEFKHPITNQKVKIVIDLPKRISQTLEKFRTSKVWE